MNTFRAVTLIAATVSMGIMAGTFSLYTHTIMPGLGRTDDRTFVGAHWKVTGAQLPLNWADGLQRLTA